MHSLSRITSKISLVHANQLGKCLKKCELGNRMSFFKNSYTKLCYKPSLYHWQLALLADHWDVASRTELLFGPFTKVYFPLVLQLSSIAFGNPMGILSRRRFVFLMYYSTNTDPTQIFL